MSDAADNSGECWEQEEEAAADEDEDEEEEEEEEDGRYEDTAMKLFIGKVEGERNANVTEECYMDQ